jgi:hypothetical protein
MKRTIYLTLMLCILSMANMKAQVRVGGSTAPTSGAILDLNSSTVKGGLLLPRLRITAYTNIETDIPGAGVQASNLTGLIVYNTDPALNKEGIYIWTGVEWKAVWIKPSI